MAIYDILFKASAETLTTIAAVPKHLGARIGITSVLHSWGSAFRSFTNVENIQRMVATSSSGPGTRITRSVAMFFCSP